MAFRLKKLFYRSHGREEFENPRSQTGSIAFDVTTLPNIVAERIATFLHGKDLINLGKTCRFWYRVYRENIVWKILVEKRFGKQPFSDRECLLNRSSQPDYKKLYFQLASSKKPATAFEVVWLNGNYLEKVKGKGSEFEEAVQLNSVCWLQINKSYLSVLPGKYSLIWRMKLDRVYLNGADTEAIEFRAKPEEGCGTELCSKWTERRLKTAERRHGSGKWFVENMGNFEVTAMCKVYVEVKGRVSYWCGGITWDYAELKPL